MILNVRQDMQSLSDGSIRFTHHKIDSINILEGWNWTEQLFVN